MIDSDGQPTNLAFNASLRTGRGVDELIGLCKGIISDGIANQAEAEFLLAWLSANKEAAQVWPANVVYERIERMLVDGHLDENEEGELVSLLLQVTGGNPFNFREASLSTSLPLTQPPPIIVVPQHRFCFTGKFLYGSRKTCSNEVIKRGGEVLDGVVRNLDYLVIGVVGSRDWMHSTHGTKIQKAVEYREKGIGLQIIDERHFVESLRV